MPKPTESFAGRLLALAGPAPGPARSAAEEAGDFAGRVASLRGAVESGDPASVRSLMIRIGHLPDMAVVSEAAARGMAADRTTPEAFRSRRPNPALARVADLDLPEVAARHRDSVKARIPDDRLHTHERLQLRREDVAAALALPPGTAGTPVATLLSVAGDSIVFSSTGRGAAEGRPAVPSGELRGREALEALSQGFGSHTITRSVELETAMSSAVLAHPSLRRDLAAGLAELRERTLGINVGVMVAEKAVAAGKFAGAGRSAGRGD